MRAPRSLIFLALWFPLVPADAAQQPSLPGAPESRPQMPPGGGRQPSPPRDRRGRPEQETGTAVIRGRVVAADTGAPLRRVLIRASGGGPGHMVTTDTEGRYELKDLPAGRYTVMANKGGYVTVPFGQRRAFEPGKPIELADGQTMERIDFVLPKGGVIAGRLLDEFGEPVAEAMVQSMRYRYMGGRKQLAMASRPAQTNDIGEFRLFGLPPGEYFVTATLRGPVMGADSGDGVGYPPTYYPGTPSAGEALPLVLALGQELSGVTFALVPTRTARITGIVSDSSGKPLSGGFVSLSEDQEFGGGVVFFRGFGGDRIRGDGSFTINGVAPGSYNLRVNADGPMDDGEFAIVPITVAGEDITGLVVHTTPGATIAGAITFDSGAPPSSGPGRIRVTASGAGPGPVGPMMGRGDSGRVRDDWSFELKGLWGKRLLRVVEPPAGWSLKAVYVGETDVTDTGLELKGSESVSDIRIILTNQVTAVTGSVTNDRGINVMDYTVVIFSADPRRWGFQSRFVRSARPDQTGIFKIDGLPPDDYLAAAMETIEEGAWSDPEFLEQLRSGAVRFTLAEGETRSIALKITPQP